MATLESSLLTVICPIKNAAPWVIGGLKELAQTLEGSFQHFEILVVDDASTDDSFDVIRDTFESKSPIRLLRLSRPMGFEVAVTAGLDFAIGDFVVVFMLGSDPTNRVQEIVNQAKLTGKVILGKIENPRRESILFRALRAVFYRLSKHWIGLDLPRNTRFFVCMSRKYVTQINRTKDRFRFLKLITTQIGMPVSIFPYQRTSTRNPEAKGLWDSISISVKIIFGSSMAPLRWVNLLCFILSLTNLVALVYIFSVYFVKESVAAGWVTLSFFITSSFCALFFFLGVIGEYFARLLEESQDRPLYYLSEDVSLSKALPKQVHHNVTLES